MARSTYLAATILSIGGIDLWADDVSTRIRYDSERAEGKSIKRLKRSPNIVKRSWNFSVELLSQNTLPARVTNLDFTALSILGTSFVADCTAFSMSGDMATQNGDAVGDEWRAPQVIEAGYTGSATLLVPTTAVPLMPTLDGAKTTWAGSLTFTLNGETITYPILVTSIEQSVASGQLQEVTVQFEGQDPQTGNYPSAPTTTTTLLQKALNAPDTALAVEFETQAANGANYTGTVVFTGFSFGVENGGVVRNTYDFAGQGAPVAAVSS